MGFIQWCLAHLNYWTIMFLMAIESSFIPFPSEIIVPPAAWMAATGQNGLNVFLVILFATIGAGIGAAVNYILSLLLGRPIVYAFANSKLGHLCLINEEKVRYAERYFDKNGAVSTLVGRLIPAVRQLISIPAGLARMKFLPFISYTMLGAGIWNCILAAIGYNLAKVPGIETQEQLLEKVNKYSHEIGFSIMGVVVVVLLIMFYKKKRRSARKGN
ncbi:DedA family protein [Porphyromonas gingivalis]|uniref:DedA family protein n=4 Tax=Porphyromonas gingivalis TaxID=837 RepID=Q7MTJ9_PORGI|nr:DedA family protein [Porphyromonas gingivalis]AAQ66933.1 DedA family protein [Porphyromonas gingivalis W83]AKV65009.1 putative membrane-associated protein [Porphyromonas gingivalis]ALA94350.1 putative membrane-associated protein [Porphyromonas gingivalis AJW4]ALJ26272.1 putative membrane-associated protein [Porphyromonas gingivalis 381]ATR90866.1 DedA family protein [Porphyromonas gingivalis]